MSLVCGTYIGTPRVTNEITDWHAACGPYGVCVCVCVCDPNGSSMCSCLQGFEPKSPKNWALSASDGCVRKKKLDCKNKTDGFVKVPQAQL